MKISLRKINPLYRFTEGYEVDLIPSKLERLLGAKEKSFYFYRMKGNNVWWHSDGKAYSNYPKQLDDYDFIKTLGERKFKKPLDKIMIYLALFFVLLALVIISFLFDKIDSGIILSVSALFFTYIPYRFIVWGYTYFD